MKNKILALLAVIVLVLIGWFVLNKTKAGETLKLGAALSLSGTTSSFYGEYAQRGLEIARNEVNAAGGVLGKQVEIVYEDTGGDKKLAVNAINKLIQGGNSFIFGDPVSGTTLAMAPIAEAQKVLLFAPGASNPNMTTAGDYIFRTKLSAAVEGVEAGKYIAQVMQPKRVAFIYQNSDYGKGVFESFKKELEAAKIKIVKNEPFATGSNDMRSNLLSIKSENPDLVVIAAFPKEVGIIMKQAKEVGINSQFFTHSGSVGPDIDLVAGKSAEGLKYLTELDLSASNTKRIEFSKVYSAKYNKDPELFSSLAYDAFMLTTDAIKSCGSVDADCIKAYLYSIKDYDGASGKTSFDQNGDIVPRSLACVVKTYDAEKDEIKDVVCE